MTDIHEFSKEDKAQARLKARLAIKETIALAKFHLSDTEIQNEFHRPEPELTCHLVSEMLSKAQAQYFKDKDVIYLGHLMQDIFSVVLTSNNYGAAFDSYGTCDVSNALLELAHLCMNVYYDDEAVRANATSSESHRTPSNPKITDKIYELQMVLSHIQVAWLKASNPVIKAQLEKI